MYDACHAPIMTCKNGNVEVGTPCIFATMHYGPYKAIGRYLLSRGISLCIPVTQRVYDTQKIVSSDLCLIWLTIERI